MKSKNLHPDVRNFVSSLTSLEEKLIQYDEKFWASKITRVREIEEKSDGYSIELFLSFFGGMGSFSDLMLRAPRSIADDFYDERERAYALAKLLEK